jgi:hypothetical protein
MHDDATPPLDSLAYEQWLDEILGVEEAARVRKVSVVTLRRERRRGAIKFEQLSERRVGVRRREALGLSRVASPPRRRRSRVATE